MIILDDELILYFKVSCNVSQKLKNFRNHMVRFQHSHSLLRYHRLQTQIFPHLRKRQEDLNMITYSNHVYSTSFKT